MRSRRILGILGLSCIAGSAQAAIWLSLATWSTANIDGVDLENGTDSLPAGWSVAWVNDELVVTNAQTGKRRANQSGTDVQKSFGHVNLAFQFSSDSGSMPITSVRVTTYYDMTAEANTEKVGASSHGIAIINGWAAPLATSVDLGPGSNWTVNKGPIKHTSTLSWTGSSGNWTSQQIALKLNEMLAEGKASNNGGSGNWTAAFGKGVTKARVTAAIMYLNIARAEGTTNAKTHVVAEPFLNNVSQGLYQTAVASGNYQADFDLSTGSYVTKFWTQGALRKSVTLSLTENQTTSGNTVTFKFGDLNGDNYVSQAEADFIFGKIGTHLNSVSVMFNPADAYWLAYADFDQDGYITTTDWTEASSNVGITGD